VAIIRQSILTFFLLLVKKNSAFSLIFICSAHDTLLPQPVFHFLNQPASSLISLELSIFPEAHIIQHLSNFAFKLIYKLKKKCKLEVLFCVFMRRKYSRHKTKLLQKAWFLSRQRSFNR